MSAQVSYTATQTLSEAGRTFLPRTDSQPGPSCRPRVTQLTSVHSPFDVRIFHKECRSLARLGFEVTLIVPTTQGGVVEGVRIRGVPCPKRRLARMAITVWQVYRAALQCQADIYHFHDPELIPAGLLLRAQGKRVIYDVHEDLGRDIQSKYYVPVIFRGPLAWVTDRLENAACHYFTGLLTATQGIAQRFQRLNRRTLVLNNFPLLQELAPARHSPWAERAPSVAYAGGITPDRGIKEIVRAMHLLPETLPATLELAGAFDPESLRNEAVSLPGWERVNALGLLDRAGVARLLGSTRAGLVLFHPEPNNVSAQPNKLFEYMSAGIPVIASDFPLWRKIVAGSGSGLLVNPLNPPEIAGAIEYLLTHPTEAEQMGRRGREAVEKNYNWECEERKLLQFYGGLLEPVCAE